MELQGKTPSIGQVLTVESIFAGSNVANVKWGGGGGGVMYYNLTTTTTMLSAINADQHNTIFLLTSNVSNYWLELYGTTIYEVGTVLYFSNYNADYYPMNIRCMAEVYSFHLDHCTTCAFICTDKDMGQFQKIVAL